MNRLSRKLTSILLIILVLAVGLNSLIWFRNVNRLDTAELQIETKNKADELAEYLAGKLRNAEVTEELSEVISLLEARVVIYNNQRNVLFSTAGDIRIKEIIADDSIIGARSEIKTIKGEVVATVLVIDERKSEERILTIFKASVVSSAIFGLLLLSLFLLVTYILVNRPLKKIMKAMSTDEPVEVKSKDWADVVEVHNRAYLRRSKQKEAQNMFLQNASHELKSPLMNIQGYMEAMEDGLYTQADASQLVISESQRIKNLVDQMIRSSKAEVLEATDIHIETIDMTGFVEDLRKMVPSKLEFAYKGDKESIVFDRTILQVILDNLVQNACRYADTQIELIYRTMPSGYSLTVKDDGAGIEPIVLRQIFERFIKGTKGKTGLGLSIVKQYVETTGGTIKAYNDGGAVFEMVWTQVSS